MATTCPRNLSSSFRTRSVLAIKSNAPAIRSRVVRVSALQNPFELIKQRRAGKKATKKAEKKATPPQEKPTPETSTDAGLVAQPGDVVTVAWECAVAATGQVVDSSSRGPMPRHVQFQMGTDAGFEPKRGLKLAYSLVTEGLSVGEMARVVSRPSGSGWFKAYEVVSMDGQLLAQLQPDEKQSPWAEDETVFTLEVLEITPPRGRATGKRRRAS